jgi:hypothetical protein
VEGGIILTSSLIEYFAGGGGFLVKIYDYAILSELIEVKALIIDFCIDINFNLHYRLVPTHL